MNASHRNPTVVGVPLLPGERVLYFKQSELGSGRAVWIILGFIFAIIVVGLYCFYRAIAFASKEEHYYVVTNFRVFSVNKRGRIMRVIEVPKIWQVKRIVGGRNHIEVSAGVINDEITFRAEEKQDMATLERLFAALRDPSSAISLPDAPFLP